MTEDIVAFFNQKTGKDLTPIFNQYLRHTAIPTLELKFDAAEGTVAYRWKVDEPGFAMPVRVGKKDNWQIIQAHHRLADHEDAARERRVRRGD